MADKKAPEVDQDGKMINPHNPELITKVPWYLGNSGPTLKHHNIQKVDHFLSVSESDELINNKIKEQKKLLKNSQKTVYRKGACKNCGAMTHKEKDCVERPRSIKKSAWKSGLDIAPDEVSLNLENFGKVSYSAKRDQWKGYNPVEYQEVIDKHNRLEIEKKKQIAEEKEKKKRQEIKSLKKENRLKEKEQKRLNNNNNNDDDEMSEASDSDSDSDYGSDEEDEDDENNPLSNKEFIEKDEKAADFQGTHVPQGGIGGNGMRVTVRNLRLREDTPKYLRNLALDSAFYDPKSRSMRLNPLPNENPEDLIFAGDNFVRHSGDALKLAANQVLCWEMQARGENIDVISNPSQAELLQKQFVEKKKVLEDSKKKDLLEKYLDGKMNPQLDPRLLLGQTETYVEYSRDGKVVKGVEEPVRRTKYEEDVYINNHTTVFGSYFNKMRSCWGYTCCHSLIKNSYCTGAVGRESNDAANNQAIDSFQARKMLEVKSIVNNSNSKELFGDSNNNTQKFDKEKLDKAEKKLMSDKSEGDEKKRVYNSMSSYEVTPEDMEVYRLKRLKGEDPMANLLESETLLEYN